MRPGTYLDFEKPVLELEARIRDMREFANDENVELTKELRLLERKLDKLTRETFASLSRWQRVQLARHPMRPYTLDYVEKMTTGFTALHGDRAYGDDRAMVAGPAMLSDRPVLIVGQQKGRTTKEKLANNFGMCHPEGYRKALRLMTLAARYGRPIVILIDTPGAFPGVEAEERGQAEAIARNLREMALLPVPIVIAIIGEGASGGALGIGLGDRILMMENSWYSVISPEGCAAILWRSEGAVANAPRAAESLRLAADDLLELGIIDRIIPEPLGGAHRDAAASASMLKAVILESLIELGALKPDELIARRRDKFRKIGVFSEDDTF
ncbi:MAG: acetyl-CoA carboxylase carboxyltransferase subunit alpha [candidate division Zixibacteria bacterium]|nr:acetyl-CoA carboxylase carboxyltransferase subunit alpha [candidate division Zixibacteria bacterium]